MTEHEPQDPALRTLSLHAEAGPGPPAGGAERSAHLLLIEGDSSSLHPLPLGEVIVGRGEDAHVRLSDRAASRRHARLVSDGERIQICDLGSHNGTLVNGAPLTASREILSGDVITIGEATLVLRAAGPVLRRPLVLGDLGLLRQRATEEIARAIECRCPLALVCFLPGPQQPGSAALPAGLRAYDQVFWAAPGGEALILLPERSAAAADAVARELLPTSKGARAGVAMCPDDGADFDTLLAGARAAAAAAPPGAAAGASASVTIRQAGAHAIVIADPAMLRLYQLIERLAQSPLPVLILGETGTGKELAAAAIHHGSPRRAGRLISTNCAALPEGLAESELFGHERGAFSGATAAREGLLEAAHGGTVFLDEIGELPLSVQAKLLRVLATGRLTRLGEVRERAVDLRVVAATNRDLHAEVAAGRFRQDLLFRLNAACVHLPPLRERPRELPLLARHFLAEACRRQGRPPLSISPEAMARLQAHPWPGNLRELRNVMDYAAATVAEEALMPWHLPPGLPATGAGAVPGSAPAGGPPPRFRPIDEEIAELERTRMREALDATGGVQTRAADLIGMPRRTFTHKLRQYDLLGRRDP